LNYGIIVICDQDAEYANCLADYFRIKGCIASDIVVFTKYDAFLTFSKTNGIDILVIHEEIFSLMDKDYPFDNTFILQEDKKTGLSTCPISLYKYTSADEILRQVMANYIPSTNSGCLSFRSQTECSVIGICSPLGRCGKSSFSLSLGLNLALKGSCLLISFDQFSPLNTFFEGMDTTGKTIFDLLYFYLQSKNIPENRLLSAVSSIQGLDYIAPSWQSNIYSEVSMDELIGFLSELSALKKYRYIVLDFGNIPNISPLYNLCRHIFLASISDDLYAEKKISNFLNDNCNKHTSPENKHCIFVPSVTFTPTPSEYIVSLTSGELGFFTKSVIDEFNL